jgi:hypothetical protein
MTIPTINLRCEGLLLGQGTIFVKKEKNENDVEVNVLFERRGLDTMLERIKNVFRKKEEETISAEDWARNLTDTIKNKQGYSAGYSIQLRPLINNINKAQNMPITPKAINFNITKMHQSMRVQEIVEFNAIVMKKDFFSRRKITTEEEKEIKDLYYEGDIYENIKGLSLEHHTRMLGLMSLYTEEEINKDQILKFIKFNIDKKT